MEENHSNGDGIILDMSHPTGDHVKVTDLDHISHDESNSNKLLLFGMGTEHYAIHIEKCLEIVEFHEYTSLPNLPGFVIGVVNVRGKIIPLLDIRQLWDLGKGKDNNGCKIVVIEHNKGEIGFLIDQIERVIEFDPEALQPPLSTIREEIAAFTQGVFSVKEKTVILLDITGIFSCSTIQNLEC